MSIIGSGVRDLDADPLVDAALALVAGDRIRPISPVFATWVPPSAWRSSPTISIVRTSAMPSGSRLIFVRIRSGMAKASSRGRTATRISRSAAISSLTRRSISPTSSPRHRLELEVHPPGERLHVAAGDRCAVIAPDDAAQDVERGVGAHQLVAPVPVDLGGHRRVRPPAAPRPRRSCARCRRRASSRRSPATLRRSRRSAARCRPAARHRRDRRPSDRGGRRARRGRSRRPRLGGRA